jgi:hypothetical protein
VLLAAFLAACSPLPSRDREAGCAAPGAPAGRAAGPAALLDLEAGLEGRLVLPGDAELLDEIRAALDFRRRDDFDRFLDARDPGELLEHATLTQIALNRGIFGPDDLFIFGDELFDYEFRRHQGLGNGLGARAGIRAGPGRAPNLRRVHEGEFGGPDGHSCAPCHSKGGPDGAGQSTQNAFLRSDGASTARADVRNPPHLLGLGPVEALAREMTAALEAQRDAALAATRRDGRPARVELEAKGVRFGSLEARPDGALDFSALEGVDPDLVVKPFGWKGHQATLRGMIEESFRIHAGIVSMDEQRRVRDGALDSADYGDGEWYDVDRDGATIEVEEGMLTTVVAYFAQLEAPVIRPPSHEGLLDGFARGAALFETIGCAGCHRPSLPLESAVLEIRSRDPEDAGRDPVRIHLAEDGEHPKIEPQRLFGTTYNVALFSDLKRHDLGPELATPAAQAGVPPSVFLTRSLWGLDFTSPYLHDGRAPTVDDAIRLHGGEAAPARDAYLALEAPARGALQVFLLSLTREPELFVP